MSSWSNQWNTRTVKNERAFREMKNEKTKTEPEKPGYN